ADCDARRDVGWEAINTGRNRREGKRCQLMPVGERDRASVAGCQQVFLARASAVPYRANRVDHMLGGQRVSARDLGAAGIASAQRSTFLAQLWSCGGGNAAAAPL